MQRRPDFFQVCGAIVAGLALMDGIVTGRVNTVLLAWVCLYLCRFRP